MMKIWRIAVREYMAFVRTPGFWISICLAPLGLTAAIFASGLASKTAPPPRLAIVDLTAGGAYGQTLARAVTQSGSPPPAVIVSAPVAGFSSADDAARRLRPYLTADIPASAGRLDAAAIVEGPVLRPRLDLWTRDLAEPGLRALLSDALADAVRNEKLEAAGLSPAVIASLDEAGPTVTQFSPKSRRGEVSARDELPVFIGFGMGIVLWSLILTGAGILLNSVIEEKSSRILEVLLTSASAPEIMAGKILGAAAVTATALMVWLTAGAVAVGSRDPQVLAQGLAIVLQHGLLFYFVFYFVGGYLMYATLFTTIGAFCETPREAQTLLGPIMLLLTVPVIFMGQAVSRPDAPLVQTLSWIPPFTPFLMAARAASGPPWWQVVGTGLIMAGATGLELLVAARAFRAGALTSGRFELRAFFAGLRGAA